MTELYSEGIGPVNDKNFRGAVSSDGNRRPPEPPIDIEAMAKMGVEAIDPTAASIRQPEGSDAPHAPLPAVTMAGENQIGGMSMVEQLQYVGRVRQEHRESARATRRDALRIGPMQ